ncbi:MAG: C-terminal binding protein [Planctomycetales bacterium]|nr:C-terminal binding protein [Planctomycetales bacterium]
MPESKFKVVVTDFIHEPLGIEREILGDIAEIVALDAPSTEAIDQRAWDADALMVYHFVSIRQPLIERLPNCKLIVRCGAGYDNIDYEFARERGIVVANVPDYGTEDVADFAMALTLSIARGTHLLSHLCQRGTQNWTYELTVPLRRIRGQVFGVIGIGRIGTATALRAKALGFDVAFYDPYVEDGRDKALGVRRVDSLEELASQSNVLSCHCLLSQETYHIVNRELIELMPPRSILINTARGGVVAVDAILYGLESGRLLGAGIDVLELEPPANDHPLVQAWRNPQHPAHERLILTPHAAFYSEQGLEDMRRKGSQNVRRALTGEDIRNIVN